MNSELDIGAVVLGRIAILVPDGSILVESEGGQLLRCVALESAMTDAPLCVGDSVVVLNGSAPDGLAVLLGRTANPRARAARAPAAAERTVAAHSDDVPNSILLEATDELTLRVGDGSITIRKDGKILIKGKDLVSHARRMNRIKGGAVSIN